MVEIKIQLPKIFLRNFEEMAKQKNITINKGIEGAMGIYMAIHLLEPAEAAALLRSLSKVVDES